VKKKESARKKATLPKKDDGSRVEQVLAVVQKTCQTAPK